MVNLAQYGSNSQDPDSPSLKGDVYLGAVTLSQMSDGYPGVGYNGMSGSAASYR